MIQSRAVPRSFAKRNADGSLRHAVRCTWFSEVPRAGSMCELQGYIESWPLFVWLPSSGINDWDAMFARVGEFVTRHVVDRTELPEAARAPQ